MSYGKQTVVDLIVYHFWRHTAAILAKGNESFKSVYVLKARKTEEKVEVGIWIITPNLTIGDDIEIFTFSTL